MWLRVSPDEKNWESSVSKITQSSQTLRLAIDAHILLHLRSGGLNGSMAWGRFPENRGRTIEMPLLLNSELTFSTRAAAQLIIHLLPCNALGNSHQMPLVVHTGHSHHLDLPHPLNSTIKYKSKLLIVLTEIKAPHDANKVNQHALGKQVFTKLRKICPSKKCGLKCIIMYCSAAPHVAGAKLFRQSGA